MAPSMTFNDAALARALECQVDDSPTEVNSSSSSSDGGSSELQAPSDGRRPPSISSRDLALQDAEQGQAKADDASIASTANINRRRRFCTVGSCCFLSLLAIILALVLKFVILLDGDINNFVVPEAWNNIFDQDPFDSVDPEDATRWRNRGQGASLKVVNALDTRWYPYFEKSMADWDNGYPDALDLTVSQVRDPDPECVPEQGFVKVCNGNYGETPWKGRAEILSDGLSGIIFAASARLNEFYLSDRNTDEMQYAMCHELGHTWGVHHTDESFTNRDLGNCMDYTNRHRNNLTPDFSNYVFLHALYGSVPGSRPYNPPTPPPTSAPTPRSVPINQGFTIGGGGNNNGGGGNPVNGNGNANPNQPGGNDNRDDKKDKKDKDKGDRRELPEDVIFPFEDSDSSSFPDELVEAIREFRRNEDPNMTGSVRVNLPGGFVLDIHQLRA